MPCPLLYVSLRNLFRFRGGYEYGEHRNQSAEEGVKRWWEWPVDPAATVAICPREVHSGNGIIEVIKEEPHVQALLFHVSQLVGGIERQQWLKAYMQVLSLSELLIYNNVETQDQMCRTSAREV